MALKQLFDHALDKVNGAKAVRYALAQINHDIPTQIIAVGKAASAMASGAWQYYKISIPTLLVSKYNHIDKDWFVAPKVTCIESAHPIPDENSLKAGEAILNTVKSLNEKDTLLLLVSGGASALAEHLRAGVDLQQLEQLNQDMLASGADIEAINQQRSELSLIKAGQLLTHFNGLSVDVLAISDVPEDNIAVIGSGIGSIQQVTKTNANTQIVGSNAMARQAIVNAAKFEHFTVRANQNNLFGPIEQVANDIAEQLINGQSGIYVFGGEPNIKLPAKPGIGGRAQSLALMLALAIKDHGNIEILVAGTDGSDGPTDATGAIVSADTVKDAEKEAQSAIDKANAYEFLVKRDALLYTGPTGTNVMDVVIAKVS